MTRLLVLVRTKIISLPRELTLKRVPRSLCTQKIQANCRVRAAWHERRLLNAFISVQTRQPLWGARHRRRIGLVDVESL